MSKFAPMLTLLFIPLLLSYMLMNPVHAGLTGRYSQKWTETGSSTLANGTSLYYAKDTFTYNGAFSGSSIGNETDNSPPTSEGGTFWAIEHFTGSFNASQQGALTFHDSGYYQGTGEAGGWATSFSGGTGGLTGLQGTMKVQYPGGNCNSGGTYCTFQGTYTVTSATWGTTPAPEFSNLTLSMIIGLFATLTCLTRLRRKH